MVVVHLRQVKERCRMSGAAVGLGANRRLTIQADDHVAGSSDEDEVVVQPRSTRARIGDGPKRQEAGGDERLPKVKKVDDPVHHAVAQHGKDIQALSKSLTELTNLMKRPQPKASEETDERPPKVPKIMQESAVQAGSQPEPPNVNPRDNAPILCSGQCVGGNQHSCHHRRADQHSCHNCSSQTSCHHSDHQIGCGFPRCNEWGPPMCRGQGQFNHQCGAWAMDSQLGSNHPLWGPVYQPPYRPAYQPAYHPPYPQFQPQIQPQTPHLLMLR
eukprot:NODE_260_length_1085_cov_117.835907_g220_i0.p1 GENE.NODE_260_length_1085_cov_117.835907_g220_i0~~NODE_260_length_1085_cov_117.835907_g220_i0.p1  ORF type:complete len:272 (-),score=52.78 NODE_260_length_1085_cov_117.835907_g220_i0:131-946(-)